jgi:hypothetical protein
MYVPLSHRVRLPHDLQMFSGWDYLGMAHTYKKLLAEDSQCREEWLHCTTLLDAASGPSLLRLGPLGVRSLAAVAHRDHGATVAASVLGSAPFLKFTGSFVGDLRSLREADVCGSASPPSTLGRLLAHALRPRPSCNADSSADGGTWVRLLRTQAERPSGSRLPALVKPVQAF